MQSIFINHRDYFQAVYIPSDVFIVAVQIDSCSILHQKRTQNINLSVVVKAARVIFAESVCYHLAKGTHFAMLSKEHHIECLCIRFQ